MTVSGIARPLRSHSSFSRSVSASSTSTVIASRWLGLVARGAVQQGYVVRMPKAYPVYDTEYAANVEGIRKYLEADWPGVHPVGRNGMHRYNNQDHSMLTAMARLVAGSMTGASGGGSSSIATLA